MSEKYAGYRRRLFPICVAGYRVPACYYDTKKRETVKLSRQGQRPYSTYGLAVRYASKPLAKAQEPPFGQYTQ